MPEMSTQNLRGSLLPSIFWHAIKHVGSQVVPVACVYCIVHDHTKFRVAVQSLYFLDPFAPNSVFLYLRIIVYRKHHPCQDVERCAELAAVNFHFSGDNGFLINPSSSKSGSTQEAHNGF